MRTLQEIRCNTAQKSALDDYLSLESDQDRLEWLMERPALHAPVPNEYRTPEHRISNCPSGLWLYHSVAEGLCFTATYSESAMVQGITSFISDLYNQRSAAEILQINNLIPRELGLERLLTITRKRAIAVLMDSILLNAKAAQ